MPSEHRQPKAPSAAAFTGAAYYEQRQMYHLAPAELRDQIKAEGLVPGNHHPESFSPDDHFNDHYPLPTIFLSDLPGCSAALSFRSLSDAAYDVWLADVSDHPLLADLLCLSDAGIYVGDDGVLDWDRGHEWADDALRRYIPGVDLSARSLLANSYLNSAAILLTETAATYKVVAPASLRLLGPGEYDASFLLCKIAGP